MSLDATRWAWQVQKIRPLRKLVLLALADRAGPDDTVWPSFDLLIADTGADRKTIWQAIRSMKAAGILEDTGQRKGRTGQIPVLRLIGVKHRCDEIKGASKGNGSEIGTVPLFLAKSSENGMLNSSENGIRNLPIEPIKETTKKSLPCPVQSILDLYHQYMPKNPRCKVINKSRTVAISERWKEAATLDAKPFGYDNIDAGLSAWRNFFEICNESKFLTGEVQPPPGKLPFLADIDFLFSPGGFAKCLENKYHREVA
jgi:hypothetical protein